MSGNTTFMNRINPSSVKLILAAMCAIIIILLIIFLYNKSSYTKTHCNDINSVYRDMGKVASLDIDNLEDPNFKLRDFYIKTAYNACALGDFTNTYVDLCALKQVIRQGVRCLDFEVYSVNNKPAVAVSTTSDYNFKQSYNSIPLYDILKTINNYAFSGGTCPNPKDPLILHFRLKTSLKKTIDQISQIILRTISTRILGKQYSYEYGGNNLGAVPIKDLMGKIIISVDNSNKEFTSTSLNEYVNIVSRSMFLQLLRAFDVRNTPNMQVLINSNKKNMSIVFPDISVSDKNMGVSQMMQTYGIQMVGMCYQNYDNNMELYETFFAENKAAFVVRPERFRYIPVTIPIPPAQTPKLSYANRPIKSDYYDHTI